MGDSAPFDPTATGPTQPTPEESIASETRRPAGPAGLPTGGPLADAVPPAALDVPGYFVLGVLGRGAMGVVYKALHLALNRIVALKMVLAGGHASAEQLARF